MCFYDPLMVDGEIGYFTAQSFEVSGCCNDRGVLYFTDNDMVFLAG